MFYIPLSQKYWRICVDFASEARHHVMLEMTINGIPRLRKIPFHLEVRIRHDWARIRRELQEPEKSRIHKAVEEAFTTFYQDNYIKMVETLSGDVINASGFRITEVTLFGD